MDQEQGPLIRVRTAFKLHYEYMSDYFLTSLRVFLGGGG